jgi:hypothetical protein
MHESNPYCAKPKPFAHKFKVELGSSELTRESDGGIFWDVLLFQKSFTHFGGTSCLINMEVGVLLKVVLTLTSMGHRFDMSTSNRFCE